MNPSKLPDVIGFYLPGDRRQDCDNLRIDPKTGELTLDPSMTKQSFVAECDINNIVRDFTQHGMIQHINERAAMGAFVDLPDTMDYQQALEIARQAQTAFDQLPAKVRARFDNDPTEFLAFMQDPANQDEAIELGLAADTRFQPPPQAQAGGETPPSQPAPPPAPGVGGTGG